MSLFNNALIGASGQQGYQISRSVRLRSSASAYLNRTPAVASNRQKWTWSGWVKRGSLTSFQQMFTAGTGASDRTYFLFTNTDTIQFYSAATSGVADYSTSALFRDPAAWYHIQLAFDSTQATAANRVFLYINGVQQTLTATITVAQNTSLYVNSTVAHTIGRESYTGANYLDGYLTEINFIDGQQLTPSSFGETNAVTGVWQPKKYAGTYGTNGFYLNFSDNSTAAALGTDFSGNSNTWTVNNISVTAGVTYDSMLDVPTPYADGGNGRGNYCVLNPLRCGSLIIPSSGNLNGVATGTAAQTVASTFGISSGKFYWEVTDQGTGLNYIGIVDGTSEMTTYIGSAANGSGWAYNSSGQKIGPTAGTAVAYGATYTNNDVIGIALDMDAGTIVFYKNNASQGTMVTGLTGTWFPAISCNGVAGNGGIANFGQRPFAYTPPTGFVALNTQNLPTPTISNGASYMAATTYTGTGSALTIANTVGSASFQPDLVWVKGRSGATDHAWYDAVRGVQNQLESNTTTAETTETTGLTAFGSTGFTVGALAQMNTNTATYVAWQWNAGGSTVTNTDGTISAQVRANATAGFSVVTYTGNGLTNQSVGHGLNATPGMVIIKQRDGTASWLVHHQSQPTGYTLYLNLTNAQDSGTSQWGTSAQTSSLFYVGYTAGATGSNVNASTYVAYCFSAVAGYSAFGSYTGNGSADGPFVFLGFRPRWVMVKNTTNSAGATNWVMQDSSRNGFNPNKTIYANASSAEDSSAYFDILSNGFKVRDTFRDANTSGDTYIYACFAENPFKLSLAR